VINHLKTIITAGADIGSLHARAAEFGTSKKEPHARKQENFGAFSF
jgi:hypothetical protein